MQHYKSSKIFLAISLLIIFSSCSSEKQADSIPLPDEFESYQFLSSNKAQSQKHRIVKVVDYTEEYGKSEARQAFYDVTRELFFIEIYRDNGRGVLVKVNSKGVILDTLPYVINNKVDSTKLYPKTHINGVVFYDDFYVDWFHTGDKSLKKYQYKADMDTMSERDFASKYRESSIVYYEEVVFNEERADVYLFNEHGWGRLSSNKLHRGHRFKTSEPVEQPSVSNLFFYEDKFCGELTSKRYPEKTMIELIQLFRGRSHYICEPNKHASASITTQYLHKVRYHPASGLGATAPIGESWSGIAYFNLAIGDDNIPFKSYSIIARPGVELLPSTNLGGQSYVILDYPRPTGSTRFKSVDENPQNESGLYLIVPN